MEPCAPGTEDELPIMYSTLTKQENEKERLIKQKAVLRNGRYENVYELSYVNGAELWFCKACECPVMGRVFQHESGRRHTQNLSSHNKHHEKQQKDEEKVPEEEDAIAIAPGEPVPPGFEEDVNRVAQIQERLDKFKVGPLVALEYLVELQDYDITKEPVYLCILCDKRGDPRTVLTHLASYNHITQYLQKHFPTCYRALAPYMTKHFKRNWQVTLQKIAEGIEKKFGRLQPFPIDKDKFEKERMHYLTMIGKGKHFSELSGYTFEELVVHDELTKVHEEEKSYENSAVNNWGGSSFIQKPFQKKSPSPPVVAVPSKKPRLQSNQASAKSDGSSQLQRIGQNRRQSLSSVSDISDNELNDNDYKRNRPGDRRSSMRGGGGGRQLPYARRRSPSPRRRSPSPRRRSPSPRRRSPSPRRRRSPSPRSRRPKSVAEENKEKEEEKLRKIEEFRKLGRAIENDLQKTLKLHEKNPEKHPQYNEEWKKFWNRRYKELQAEGVDVAKHDFKPEWIQFWNRRMVELHSDELRSRKDALRKRLALPEDVNPIKFSIGNQPKPTPPSAQPDQDNEVIIIDDKDDKRKGHSRSRSPWEKESSPRLRNRKRSLSHDRARRNRSQDRHRHLSKDHSPSRKVSSKSKERDLGYGRSTSPYNDEHSRSYSPTRDRDTGRIRDPEFRDRNRRYDSRERSWERRSELDRERERRGELERERERRGELDRERDRRRMEYRESSYERDMRGRERVRTVADLPWEREKAFDYYNVYRPPHMMRDVTRRPVLMVEKPMKNKAMPHISPEKDDDDDTEVNVVNVLRILTALEERLGSLGPKIVDLLAQALALEKNEANSSETLLDSDINCVMFETIKEKLKGQLLTGLVDIIQQRAFKTAIKKIASLIHLASQRKNMRLKHSTKARAVTVPGVGAVDRAAIAKQIANALILQGKTDVTQAELEQLINAVVGMAEASKNVNKPMTTASFLQNLTGTQLGARESRTESGDRIIIPTSAKKDDVVEIEKLTEPLTPSPGRAPQNMENLSDSDLQTLLQNFKDLSTEEQHNLINYLKKLEYDEPERVEKLRQFVDLETGSKKLETEAESNDSKKKGGRESPFSNRSGGVNPASEDLVRIESEEEDMNDDNKDFGQKEEKERKIHLDSEEEDYTFEDVVKTASKNVKDKELESNMKIVKESMKFDNAKKETDLNSAKDLISNLMSNITKSTSTSKSIDLLGLGAASSSSSTPTSNIMTSSADFAKTLSNINIANLASIVNNVKTMSEEVNKKLNFEPPPSLKNSESLMFESAKFDPILKDVSPSSEIDKFDRRLEESTRLFPGPSRRMEEPLSGRLDEPARSFLSTANKLNEPGRPFPNPFRSDDRDFPAPGGRSDDMGRSFGGPIGVGSNMRGPSGPPVDIRDFLGSLSREMHTGPSRDMPLGQGRDMSLGPSRDMPLGSGRDMPLGSNRDMSLGPSRDMPLGPGRDMPFGSGSRGMSLASGREMTLGSGREMPLGSGREMPLGSGREMPLGSGREMPLGSGREMPLGSGREMTLGTGREMPLRSGRDLPLGSGRDLPVGPSRDLPMSLGRDLGMISAKDLPPLGRDLGANRDMSFGRDGGQGYRPLLPFPRGPAAGTTFGSNLSQSQLRGPRLTLLDRRNDQRFNNYGDFGRPGGNFNRW